MQAKDAVASREGNKIVLREIVRGPSADVEVVEFLEELLELAREGKISTIAATWIDGDGAYCQGWIADDDPELLACAAYLENAVKDEMFADPGPGESERIPVAA